MTQSFGPPSIPCHRIYFHVSLFRLHAVLPFSVYLLCAAPSTRKSAHTQLENVQSPSSRPAARPASLRPFLPPFPPSLPFTPPSPPPFHAFTLLCASAAPVLSWTTTHTLNNYLPFSFSSPPTEVKRIVPESAFGLIFPSHQGGSTVLSGR